MANAVWVRLHLERQSESSNMPDSIIGFLTDETPGAYVLSKVIDFEEDEYYKVTPKEDNTINMINRTYVWRCEILGNMPTFEDYNGESTGGLG